MWHQGRRIGGFCRVDIRHLKVNMNDRGLALRPVCSHTVGKLFLVMKCLLFWIVMIGAAGLAVAEEKVDKKQEAKAEEKKVEEKKAEAEAEEKAEEDPAPGHSHAGEAFNEGPRQSAVKIADTGNVHFPVTVAWSEGQQFFNQGVGQLHGFWSYEAERTFRQIAAQDPNCAMAYWGMAMANNGNARRAKGFIKKAMELKDKVTPRERLYIEAQSAFLGEEPKDAKARKQKLIEALENIIHEHPDDIEAKAFLVVRLWEFSRQGIPIGSRQSVDALLDQVFAVNPKHPAHHYRIHLWDGKKPRRALGSAGVLHATAPAIAHMWHMSGHIYDKLKRYPESSYHQEASARVDHKRQAEYRVLPDTIHNYAHNNEWLVRNWNHIGRADDAVAMAKGMINNPQHPKLNHYKKGNSSAAYGRRRLLETLERFEFWQEIIELADTHYLEPTDQLAQQVARNKALARAHFGLKQKDGLIALRDEIAPRVAEAEEKKKKQSDQAKEKAKKEKKNKKDTDKMVKDATKGVDGDLKQLRPLKEEITVYLELLDGAKLDDDKAKKIKRSKSALALIHLEYGEAGKAGELAAEAVKESEKRTVPLAVQVHVLEQSGKKDEAAGAFAKLHEISTHIQLDAAPFSRISPVAKRLGKPKDWRTEKSWRGDDFGKDKPEDLTHLGPLAYESPTAPDFALIAEDGKNVSLSSFSGKPVILVFYLGHNCEHCVEQLNAFAPMASDFEAAGISLAAIGPEPLVELAKAHELCAGDEKRFPFPLYSDLSTNAFKAYRSYDDFEDLPLHGTFLIDGERRLRWMDVGPEPFQKPDFLLKEAKRLLEM